MKKMILKSRQLAALCFTAGVLVFPVSSTYAAELSGEELVAQKCAACHKTGVVGAPKIGAKDEWAPRIKKGDDAMLKN